MPKGKSGTFGTGPFLRVLLPKVGAEAISKEQSQLVRLNDNRDVVMTTLRHYCRDTLPADQENQAWDSVIRAVGGYLGQVKTGLPLTEGEQRSHLVRIAKAARKLDELLDNSDFHTHDLTSKAISRFGGDLPYLRKCLADLRDVDVIADNMIKPKGLPNPYFEHLLRDLIAIWREATGKHPGKTGDTHSEPSTRTSPFYRWCQAIADNGLGKPLPRDLIDMLIDQTRTDG